MAMLRRLWRVFRPHQHSIYTWCMACHGWGINFPNDPVCGHCQSTETIEYYPVGRA